MIFVLFFISIITILLISNWELRTRTLEIQNDTLFLTLFFGRKYINIPLKSVEYFENKLRNGTSYFHAVGAGQHIYFPNFRDWSLSSLLRGPEPSLFSGPDTKALEYRSLVKTLSNILYERDAHLLEHEIEKKSGFQVSILAIGDGLGYGVKKITFFPDHLSIQNQPNNSEYRYDAFKIFSNNATGVGFSTDDKNVVNILGPFENYPSVLLPKYLEMKSPVKSHDQCETQDA